jgi:hypothetical protein
MVIMEKIGGFERNSRPGNTWDMESEGERIGRLSR